MRWLIKVGIGAVVGLGTLLGVGWGGWQIDASSFAPAAERNSSVEWVPLPVGTLASLPPPVARAYRAIFGDHLPVLRSAVLTGRGHLRVAGITFPARLRFTHEAGSAYRHEIDCTWFGLPVMRVDESYRDGHARLRLPFGTVADAPKVDEAANLALWGEQLFWLPSVTVTDPRVRWEAIDATSARLIVPSGQPEDAFTVTFDPNTGLPRQLDALRYRAATDSTKTPWRIEALSWRTFDGVRLPGTVAVTWLDEGSPWLVMTLEDVAYSSDVAATTPTGQ